MVQIKFAPKLLTTKKKRRRHCKINIPINDHRDELVPHFLSYGSEILHMHLNLFVKRIMVSVQLEVNAFFV